MAHIKNIIPSVNETVLLQTLRCVSNEEKDTTSTQYTYVWFSFGANFQNTAPETSVIKNTTHTVVLSHKLVKSRRVLINQSQTHPLIWCYPC